MIVLDASVIIAHLDGQDAHHRRATTVLAGAVAEGFGVSPLTLAEVLVGPARAGRLHTAVAAVEAIGIDVVTLNADAPAQLASLRAHSRLRLPDCCVLLAARTAQAPIATFDERLAAVARDLGVPVVD